MTALQKWFYTPEQYLALERQASYKSEYVNGGIFGPVNFPVMARAGSAGLGRQPHPTH